MQDWDAAHAAAEQTCCRAGRGAGLDMAVDDEQQGGPDLRLFLRSTLEAKVAADLHWR